FRAYLGEDRGSGAAEVRQVPGAAQEVEVDREHVAPVAFDVLEVPHRRVELPIEGQDQAPRGDDVEGVFDVLLGEAVAVAIVVGEVGRERNRGGEEGQGGRR